ncbi:uncharacterized protein LOC127869313 isoform X2 [Dreissena polymorpha]|uniref:uncharacterized protein LOC127869313 isoform X1 n=1 Tax=Dreissena polymorpha TaxID=45954 RepID=UPI0022655C4A|nr:uncharacterized protein LOC127869313 isoform X1 [Dreissena polymorpha]XP_052267727.1 uncharacterized protein LOC127869313 isoform X2 [Dreissena polymorpha]
MTCELLQSLYYLAQPERSRLIVAGIFLSDGRAALVDRKNSVLIVTDIDQETYEEVNLLTILPEEYHCATDTAASGYEVKSFAKKGARNALHVDSALPQPSDVNRCPGSDNMLVVTFTCPDHSIAVKCELHLEKGASLASRLLRVLHVRISDRTRTVVSLSDGVFIASTPDNVVVLSEIGDDLGMHRREKRDRGGLLMTDGHDKVYFGDGNFFVGCRWSGNFLQEMFRFQHKRMKFPRGSAIDEKGCILVCCEDSHNIFRLNADGSRGEVIYFDGSKKFGDVDIHPDGRRFLVTFWTENAWPLIFRQNA